MSPVRASYKAGNLIVRQVSGTVPAQVPGGQVSDWHGVGGMFAASGKIVMLNRRSL